MGLPSWAACASARVPLLRLRWEVGTTAIERYYTTSAEEHREAMHHHGYTLEGIVGEVYERPAPDMALLLPSDRSRPATTSSQRDPEPWRRRSPTGRTAAR